MIPPDEIESPAIGRHPVSRESHGWRRAAGTALLTAGGVILNGLFMILLPVGGDMITLSRCLLAFGVPAAILIIAGIVLLGRRRWAGILGIVMSSLGVVQLVEYLLLRRGLTLGELQDRFELMNPGIITDIMHSSLVFGILSLITGVFLIWYQCEDDREKPSSCAAGTL